VGWCEGCGGGGGQLDGYGTTDFMGSTGGLMGSFFQNLVYMGFVPTAHPEMN
jgi:hypothetical protein